MKSKFEGALILAVAVALFAGSGAWAGESEWTDKDGNHIVLHADMMFIGEEDGETFDVGELLDGETRTFGEGDKQVTVTREGDSVTIERTESDARNLELTCTIGRDTCQVVTFEDDPEKVMIVVQKTRECVNGVGDCDAMMDVDLESIGDGSEIHAIIKKMKCDGAGNCEETEDVMGGGAMKIIADVHSGGPHENVVILKADELAGDHVMLRCPEGDSTVRVSLEEAEDTFLCPKHSLKMEKGTAGPMIHKIHVKGE